jgi:3-isopropylmalate/(R)-2-methylmalate dehydratase large subunit
MLLHEVSSPQAFAGLRAAGRAPRRTAPFLAVADHAVPNRDCNLPIADPRARAQGSLLEANSAAAGVAYLPPDARFRLRSAQSPGYSS